MTDDELMRDYTETVSYVGDREDWRDLPDEERRDLSFRDKLAAISLAKPRKPRRGPKKYEAKWMSLAEIPERLDASLFSLRSDLESGLMAVEDVSDAEAAIVTTLHDMAQFGAEEVRRELVRQGASIHVEATPVDLSAATAAIIADLATAIRTQVREMDGALRRKTLTESQRQDALLDHMARRIPSIAGRFARRAVNEGFALGRASELRALSQRPISLARGKRKKDDLIIDKVVQTAILDKSTCEECEKVDGEVTVFGSARQEELAPPYYRCLGGENCRCVQLAILSDDTMIEIADGKVVEIYEPEDDE